MSHWSEKRERKETLIHFIGYKTFLFVPPGAGDTYDNVDDGMDGSHLGGPGVVCSREVLSVVMISGDQGQPGVLKTQTHK